MAVSEEQAASVIEAMADRLQLAVPEEIRRYRQWLVWRYEPGDEKPRKVPYYTTGQRRSGVQGGDQDLAQLVEFSDALTRFRAGGFDGVGFAVLQNSPVKAIDLDNCVDGGKLIPEAAAILTEADSYAEFSPSGGGLRILAYGSLPSRKSMNRYGPGRHLELFGTSGFVTITGNILADAAIRPMSPAFQAWLTKQAVTDANSESPERAAEITITEDQRRDLRSALAYLDPEDYDNWIHYGIALKALGNVGRGLWLEWGQMSPRFDSREAAAKWDSFQPRTEKAITYQSILFRAQSSGWVNPLKNAPVSAAPEPDPPAELVLTLDQLYERAKNVRWAVKGLVPEQGVGFIYGASQAFKSFVTLDYALHRAWGMKWLGRKTKQAAPVYLAAEGGTGLIRRVEAWHQARGLDWRKCPMRVVSVPLTLRTQAKHLRAAITAAGVEPGDVVIDTMSQTFTGDENSNDQVADFLRVLGVELRDALGCTVLIVHHTGHSASERPRGASAIIANVDFAFGVMRDGKELLATVEFAKVKDGERPEPQTFELSVQQLGKDEDGDPITSLAARHINNAEALVEAHQREGAAGRGGRNMLLVGLAHSGMPERDLRKAFYEVIPEVKDPHHRKIAFYRARDWATKAGFFEIAGEDRRVIMLKELSK